VLACAYDDLRFADLRLPAFLRFGTFAPDLRASESAMAIACLRLFTLRFDLPDLSVPFLRARRVFSIVF